VQTCSADDEAKGYGQHITSTIRWIESDCGLPADTVKLTPPALDTCEGAKARWGLLGGQCPESADGEHTPATCGPGTECPALISTFDDATVSQLRAGYAVAGYPLCQC